MGKPIYITDPVVAAAYHVSPGQFAYVALDAEAAWLVAQHHGYPLNYATTLPAAYYVHPLAPLPFVPFVPVGGTNPVPPPPPAPTPPPAPSPSPTPPPAPAPQASTVGVGPEDQHIKIDVDGDGTTDVHVIVDNPPKNTP
jgi:hypothetical protein